MASVIQDLHKEAWKLVDDYHEANHLFYNDAEKSFVELGIGFGIQVALPKESRQGPAVRTEEPGDGVWVIYGYDQGPYAKSIHQTQYDVLLHHESGYEIAFWPHDMDLRDAIELWGKHCEAKRSDFTSLMATEKPFG